MQLSTAGETIEAKTACNCNHSDIDGEFEALVVPCSPPVKSVGKRCKVGWGMWRPLASYSDPAMIPLGCLLKWPGHDQKDVVQLEITGDIPYFVADQCQPCTPTSVEGGAVEGREPEEDEKEPKKEF